MTEGKTTILDELLGDPLVQLVMERDRVRPEDLRRMLERDRIRTIGSGLVPPAHVISTSRANRLCC